MVLALEEVSWTSVSNAADENVERERTPGHAKDRSLSYLDLRDQLFTFVGENLFESVRRFGRPRQQISEVVSFVEESKETPQDRYHFGQCLVLPKVSTLPPKGNNNRLKNRVRQRACPIGSETCVKHTDNMYSGTPRSTLPRQEAYDLYGWSDNPHGGETHHPKKTSRRSSTEGSIDRNHSLKSIGRKELSEFYNGDQDDIEAQADRYRREIKAPDDYYYRQSTLERRNRRHRDAEEISRLSDARENWRLRVMKENESKPRRLREPEGLVDDAWEVPVVRSNWNAVTDSLKRELHRSKSTPDMLGNVDGRRKLEIWQGEPEEPRRNGSMVDMHPRSWTGEYADTFSYV
ncbi:hypothetical protein RUM44_007672 [Polyplax serrata]|uniref:Uncharacterized protein n=1 Tax=Polyplax serrata TaxID=468196 RepID=A0ABR1BB21_POLSC